MAIQKLSKCWCLWQTILILQKKMKIHTPFYWAANFGHTEIVRILAPLADNPNAPAENGETPIYVAASKGHTEIVKYLASLNLRK